MGTCIALTLFPASAVVISNIFQVLVACTFLAVMFGLLFIFVSREDSIFVTSYGGSYLVWHGLELIDSQVFEGRYVVPAFVTPTNVDMWFSVLSFLVVGLLGCCVQLILVGGQSTVSSRAHYDDDRLLPGDVRAEYVEIP